MKKDNYGMCTKLNVYHSGIVTSTESEEAATQEQAFFDEHQCKTMEFVDRLGDLLAKPQPNVPTQFSANDHLVDRQLDLLSASVRSISGVFENPELIDTHVLAN